MPEAPNPTAEEAVVNTREVAPAEWSAGLRVAFRFVFSYLAIYCFTFLLLLLQIPGISVVGAAYTRMWKAFVFWIATHILHLQHYPIPLARTGSGDSAFNYVQLLCFVAFAGIATLLWTLLDRRRKQYRPLYEALRIYVRYFLGFTLLGYGMAKVIDVQFSFPGLEKLAEPFGNLSPMNLLWYFMGYSTAYTHFTGAVEAIGGLLLFFRRTTTLGALVASAAIVNVAALNYFYDVPVKLFSTNLLLMIFFLLAPELRRLANFLVLNRAVAPISMRFPWSARWVRASRVPVKVIIIAIAIYANTAPYLAAQRMRGLVPRSPLYGIYAVQPAISGTPPWRTVVFQYQGSMLAILPDLSPKRYNTIYDTARNTVTISTEENPGQKNVFTYSRPDQQHLVLQGDFRNAPVIVRLQKIDPSHFVLVNRGYHWINESSFQP